MTKRVAHLSILFLALSAWTEAATNSNSTIASYGLDVSFPALQDTVQKEGNPLGNRHDAYLDYMEGCRRTYDGDGCDRYEHQRMLMNRRQPVSMEVRASFYDVVVRKRKILMNHSQ